MTERITEIPDIADRLCDPYPHIERVPFHDHNRNKKHHEHRVTLPGLLAQMAELFEPSANPDGGSPAAISKPPVRWDAMAEHTSITIAAVRWCWELRLDQRDTVQGNIRQLVGATMDSDMRERLRRDMFKWMKAAEIVTGWRTPPMDPRAPCPAFDESKDALCEQRTLRINLAEEEGYCASCGAFWDAAALPGLANAVSAYKRAQDAQVQAQKTRRRKRQDLTPLAVLSAVAQHGQGAWDMLCLDFPPKVVLAAFERDVDARLLDYGVALRRPFLTDKGREHLRRATEGAAA